jgi:hypothetical protein
MQVIPGLGDATGNQANQEPPFDVAQPSTWLGLTLSGSKGQGGPDPLDRLRVTLSEVEA